MRAQATVTFVGLKQGLFTADGPDFCGRIFFDDLGVPPAVYQKIPPSALRLDLSQRLKRLKPRKHCSHKGLFGHVLVIGGDAGMSGAVRLAAEGALRVGAGLVSVATRAAHAAFINATRPELMCHGVETAQNLSELLDRATVIAIGPGLGQSPWGLQMLDAAIATNLPLVVDADGLNLLCQKKIRRGNWILTPHPGEAARLLGCTNAEIQNDRFQAVRELSQKFSAVSVLKGCGTLVYPAAHEEPIGISCYGNPGMASAGMGDVLTGVIAGLAAQGLDLKTAAQLGVCLHGAAGDQAAKDGQRGMTASDLFAPLRVLLNATDK